MIDHDDSADPASQVISSARATEQAIQQLCRTTLTRPSMAPAEVDIVLAHLADAAAALPQAASQLGDILAQASDRVLEMDNLTEIEDPDVAIDIARVHLDGVRDAALDVYRLLNAARNETAHIAVAGRPTEDTDDIMQDTPKVLRPENRQPPTLVKAVDPARASGGDVGSGRR
jgi:hypothetical protein